MNTVKTLGDFRRQFGINQEKLAILLGINRGQLSMVEKHRRQLDVPAILKLAELEKAHAACLKKTSKAKKETLPGKTSGLAYKKLLLSRLKRSSVQLYQFQKEYSALETWLRQQEQWSAMISHLKTAGSTTVKNWPDRQWLLAEERAVHKILVENGESDLLALQLKIDILKTELLMLNKLMSDHFPNEKLPKILSYTDPR